ncbi:MAG: TatD family hydrolase, partial [Pontiella sp.]|nr:TatD family hydrolase [Pontiella sp.]
SAEWLAALEKLLLQYPQAGVGEIGIAHAVEERDDADQEAVFLAQLEIAQRLDRPVSIHCRRAWGRLVELLDGFGELPRGMLIHCFGGSAETATELVARGGVISFSGSITRPNNKKAAAAIRAVPADRILIETDAPDILPHNCRAEMVEDLSAKAGRAEPVPALQNQLNEPANLKLVLQKAAELRGVDEGDLAALTFQNTEHFFRGTDLA